MVSVFKNKFLIFGLVLLILCPFFNWQAETGSALTLNHHYPKLANLYYAWNITPDQAKELSKWDVLLIDMEVQVYSPKSLELLKKYNPNIKLLAYVGSQEIRGDSGSLNGTLHQKLYNQIADEWWLRDVNGNKVHWWPGNPIINLTSETRKINGQRWYEVLPWFMKNEVMISGLWDGVFYDNVWSDLGFLQSFQVDLNQDGQAENLSELNKKWQEGMTYLLSNTRNVLGEDYLVVGNGGETYYKNLNGVVFETFLGQGWVNTFNRYRQILNKGQSPVIGIVNFNVNNSGQEDNYQKMRFGFATALMGNGYYSFDNGDQSHSEVWWYDEYEVSLGEPKSQPVDISSGSQYISKTGVWKREFENGLVLVNSTKEKVSINLGGEFEKIHGQQDPNINNGLFVEKVELPAEDGLVLLRPVDKIENQSYVNGSFARVFNRWGHVARTGFFAYDNNFKGGEKILVRDLDFNGSKETLVADDSKITIYNAWGQKITSFYPYDEHYNQGINFTVGDLDNNGILEIVTGTERGGGPHVRIFNHQGKLINPGFFAYAENFRGGVDVAVGDLEGDGYLEIIAGAGYGGGPHVRVFASDGVLINPGFFAYDESFRGGVNVAVGDVDGDGIDEIITGPGYGGQPHVKIFDKNGVLQYAQFFAFSSSQKNGVEVIANDIDDDGQVEIMATSNDVFTLTNK